MTGTERQQVGGAQLPGKRRQSIHNKNICSSNKGEGGNLKPRSGVGQAPGSLAGASTEDGLSSHLSGSAFATRTSLLFRT